MYIVKGTLLQAWCIQLSNLSNKFATPIANFLCNILPLKVVLLGFMHYKRNIIEGDPKKMRLVQEFAFNKKSTIFAQS